MLEIITGLFVWHCDECSGTVVVGFKLYILEGFNSYCMCMIACVVALCTRSICRVFAIKIFL